jgi:hypothetical protein
MSRHTRLHNLKIGGINDNRWNEMSPSDKTPVKVDLREKKFPRIRSVLSRRKMGAVAAVTYIRQGNFKDVNGLPDIISES